MQILLANLYAGSACKLCVQSRQAKVPRFFRTKRLHADVTRQQAATSRRRKACTQSLLANLHADLLHASKLQICMQICSHVHFAPKVQKNFAGKNLGLVSVVRGW
jgi:hypothetical protein